jgi:integrase
MRHVPGLRGFLGSGACNDLPSLQVSEERGTSTVNDEDIVLPRGLGSIYFRKDTGKYQALRPPRAGIKRESDSFATKTEAAMWLIARYNEAAGARVTGDGGMLPRGDVKFRDAVIEWNKRKSIKESTRATIKNGLVMHVRGHTLASRAMGTLVPDHLVLLLDALPFNSRKYTIGRQLSAFCTWAHAHGYTATHLYRQSDAVNIVKATKKRSAEWRRPSTDVVWSPTQTMALIAAEPNPLYQLTFAIMAVTGARCGDVLGLEQALQFLDAEYPWGYFQKNITTTDEAPVIEETGKGGKRRTAFYGSGFAAFLRSARADQLAYRAGCPHWEGDWLLDRRTASRQTMGRFGMFLSPGTVQHRLATQAARIGNPHGGGPHVLRRSLATLANAKGYDKSMRIDVLGHEPDVSDGYVKTPDDKRHHFAEHMSKLLLPAHMLNL